MEMTYEQKKRIASIVHTDCTLIPGATFYNAAEMAITATLAALASDSAGTPSEDARNRVTLDRRDLWDSVRGEIHAALSDGMLRNYVGSAAWEEASNRTLTLFQKIVDAAPVAPAAPMCEPKIGDNFDPNIEDPRFTEMWHEIQKAGYSHGWLGVGLSAWRAALSTRTPIAADAAAQPCGVCEGDCGAEASGYACAVQWPNPVAWRDKHETSDLYARMPNPEQVDAEALYTAGQVREMLARASQGESNE